MKYLSAILCLVLVFHTVAHASALHEVQVCFISQAKEHLSSSITLNADGMPESVKYWENSVYGGSVKMITPQPWSALDRNDYIDKYKFSNFEAILFHNIKTISVIRFISLSNEINVKFNERLYQVEATDGEYAYLLSRGGRDYSLGTVCESF